MTDPQTIKKPLGIIQWLVVAGSTGLACGLAFWFLDVSGRKISPIWPAAGFTVAYCYYYGRFALPPLMAGHLVVWGFLSPFDQWPIFLIPVLYPLQGFFVAWLGDAFTTRFRARIEMLSASWRYIGAPLVGCIPLALCITWLFTKDGRFSDGFQGITFFLILMAHTHGALAFTPLLLHLLKGDFLHPEMKTNRLGLISGFASLVLMVLAFRGAFAPVISPGSAIYLPFPLLMIAAVTLPAAPVSLLTAIWCLMSTGLNSLGTGPFVVDPQLSGQTMNSAELSIYNMLTVSLAYLVSIESTRLRRSLNLNEIAMSAVDINLWEWDKVRGLVWIAKKHPDPPQVEIKLPADRGMASLVLLSGTRHLNSSIPDSWRSRLKIDIRDASNKTNAPFESVGKILHRDKDGNPIQAIGLVQDLSGSQKAERALRSLERQTAKLKSLQSNLNPHFLFNSLNVIRALVHIDAHRADEAVTSLARLLRSSLRTSQKNLITLREELHQCTALLQLAKLRFGERLSTTIDVPDHHQDFLVPPMLLLNLVENAITHGVEKLTAGGLIKIQTTLENDHLHVVIQNGGTLAKHSGSGLGTSDVRQRLALLYPGKSTFRLHQPDQQTVSAEVSFPKTTSPLHANAIL